MIRLAKIGDLEAIQRFDPFSGNRHEDISEYRLFVYEQSGSVIGFIVLARAGLLGRPYVQYLAVSEQSRRGGVASHLLQHIEHCDADQRLFISTESTNAPMQKLLINRGYTLAGEVSGANLSGASELYYCKDGGGV